MAIYTPSKSPDPIGITNFLGINETVGDTDTALGETTAQLNFRITQNYKLQKRQGYSVFINCGNTKNIQGLWRGTIANKEVLIFANDAKVYEYDMTSTSTKTLLSELIADGDVTQIGAIADAKTTMFYFEDKLYFLDGTNYKVYNGTTFGDVDPYVPTIAIGTPPAGGGTVFDAVNLLTGKKKQEFLADGVATLYQLAETGLDSATVTVTVNGTAVVEGTGFTVDRTAGTVNFAAGSTPYGAPADEAEVIITWTKTISGDADLVKKNRYALINGPGNDTAIFLWGNPNEPNRRSWSATLKANYFPSINYTYVGSNEFAITDIVPQYSRQIIFKQDRTHFSFPEWNTTAEAWDYPVYDLNEKVGNECFGGVQLIKNNPISLHKHSWWEWTSSAVEDEKNVNLISEKLRNSLSALDLSTAVTFDYQKEKEYWVNVGSKVYIWNYGNNAYYVYDNISAKCFLDIDSTIYFGTAGTIERFGGINDNGTAINAQAVFGFEDWGALELKKNSRDIFVSILPDAQTSVSIYYKTNRVNEFTEVNKVVEYRYLDFNNLDFENFSFYTNENPQTFRRKIRAKKYTYIQFKFVNNDANETLTVLGFKIKAESVGEVR